MGREQWWWLAKGLQAAGMVVVLAGLGLSVGLGCQEQGLESMAYEGYGLALGGALFFIGWIVERRIGAR